MDLVPHQYHVGKVFKSTHQAVVVSAGYYDVIVGLLFTLGTLDQVGACPNHVENTSRMSSSLATTIEDNRGHPSQDEAQYIPS
jgi:hypothetical protein